MRRVDIYLETSTRYLGKKERYCGYVMSTELKNGNPYTVEDFWPSSGTWNHTMLETLNRALSHLAGGLEIHIHSQNDYIMDMAENNLEEWKAAGFKTGKGMPIKDADLWEEYAGRTGGHLIIYERGLHEYSNWMIGTMARKMVENPVDKSDHTPRNPHKY